MSSSLYDVDTAELVAYAPFFGYLGAFTALTFSVFGAAHGTATIAKSVFSAGVHHPGVVMKAVIPVVMAGVIAIYGLVFAMVVKGKIHQASEGYTIEQGFSHLAAGLTVGLCGVACGYATGLSAGAGVQAMALQPKMFMGMVLVLIFAGALSLYGLIAALIIATPS